MDFIDSVIMTRASARNYTGESISRETLERIARAGMAAPSAVNVQPWELVIVTERPGLEALGLGAVWTAVYPDEARIAAVRRLVGLPANIIPLNVIPVGVIAGARAQDKYRPGAVHFERW